MELANLLQGRGSAALQATVRPDTAINLNTGDQVWMKPNGDGPRDQRRNQSISLPPLGQPGRASPLVTKTLLFIGEGDPVKSAPSGRWRQKFRA